MKTRRKILYGCFLAFFIVELITSIGIELCYSANLPRSQEEGTGHIHRMVVNHGSVVYGTDREFRAYRWVGNLRWPAIVGAFAVLFVGLGSGDLKMAPGRRLNE